MPEPTDPTTPLEVVPAVPDLSDSKLSPIVSLEVIRGQKEAAPSGPLDQRTPFADDAESLLNFDRQVLNLLVEVGKFEEQIIAIAHQKIEKINELRAVRVQMEERAKVAAGRVGIETGDPNKVWQFNFSTRMFVRIK